MDPKNVVATIINGTTSFPSHPETHTPIKQIAGTMEAENVHDNSEFHLADL